MAKTWYSTHSSPVGRLFLAMTDTGALLRLSFLKANEISAALKEPWAAESSVTRDDAAFAEVRTQLDAYFAAERTTFNLPLKPHGTPFQQAVWERLCHIPFGTCKSYGEIAQELEKPGASRAVGLANNKNPIAIVIPCHRVIGNNGKLVGFGGGTDVKHQLLVHEGYFLI